jgi:hypothetical protein
MRRAKSAGARFGGQLKKTNKQLRETGKAAHVADKALDSMWARGGALAGGLGLSMTVRNVGNLQERFTRLGIQARKTRDEMTDLRHQIEETALNERIRVDPDLILGAVEKIVEKTGNLELAKQNLDSIGFAISATGAAGEDIGSLVADIFEKMGEADALNALDLLIKQGKEAAFPLKALAQYGPRATAAYAALGRTGSGALTEMGALLQIAYMGTGEAAMASTSLEALTRDIVSNSEEIQGLGVTVWDEEALARGEKKVRSVPELLHDVLTATGGDIERIVKSGAFTDPSMSILKVLLGEEGQRKLDLLLNIKGDGAELMSDSAEKAKDFNNSMGAVITQWNKFATDRLTGPMNAVANLLNAVNSGNWETLFTGLTYAAGALSVAVAARGIYKTGRWIGRGAKWAGRLVGIGKKGGQKGGALSEVLGGANAMPVEVINWPGGLGLGARGSAGAAARGRRGRGGYSRTASSTEAAAGRGGFLRRLGGGIMGRVRGLFGTVGGAVAGREGGLLRRLGGGLLRGGKGLMRGIGRVGGKLFRPLGMLMNGMDLVGAVASGSSRGIGRNLGGLGGSLGGAAAGAALGSVVPIVGTAIGGLIGSILGGLGGEAAGEALGGAVEGDPSQTAAPASTQAAVPAPGGGDSRDVYITVNSAPGMDEEALARRVAALVMSPNPGALNDA